MVLAVKGQQRDLANTSETPPSKYEAGFRPSQNQVKKSGQNRGAFRHLKIR
jgi:hypothetical protein